MRSVASVLLHAFAFTGMSAVAVQTGTLTTTEAKSHIGQTATVCGTVRRTRYAETSNGKPTFLNLDKPYPNPTFTIVIFGSDREKFGQPEINYRDKDICVKGKITEFRGAPEIVVKETKQIVEGKK